MGDVDWGKQVGPLPLGAWVAVVGTGVAVALYSRRTGSNSAPPIHVNDTSGDYGVGTGEVGGWVPTSPSATTVTPTDSVVTITDNISWGQRATTWLISQGYDAALSNQAITKALASGEAGQMSASEWTLWRLALMRYGAPPEPVYTTEPGTSVISDPVDPPAAPEPVEPWNNFSGDANAPNPADLAVWQAQYDALNGLDHPLQALAYWKGVTRNAELMNYYAQRFVSTHGGIR